MESDGLTVPIDAEDSITFAEGRRPACDTTVLISEESHSREGRRI